MVVLFMVLKDDTINQTMLIPRDLMVDYHHVRLKEKQRLILVICI